MKRVLVKIGGSPLSDVNARSKIAAEIVALHRRGTQVIVVHGGGVQVTEMLERLNIPSEFIGGLRVTTPEVMNVVRMVLVGQVQRELVMAINAHGSLAIGLSGEDANCMRVKRRSAVVDSQVVDIGLVGDITHVDPLPFISILDRGGIPVMSSVAIGSDHQIHNVNADMTAAALAAALHVDRLVLLTDVEGLYAAWPSVGPVINRIDIDELQKLLPSLDGGMLPKIEACICAIRGGVGAVQIVDGRGAGALLTDALKVDPGGITNGTTGGTSNGVTSGTLVVPT